MKNLAFFLFLLIAQEVKSQEVFYKPIFIDDEISTFICESKILLFFF